METETNTKLEVGDIAQLKSGGPLMTVSIAEKKAVVQCCWFNKDIKLEVLELPTSILNKIS